MFPKGSEQLLSQAWASLELRLSNRERVGAEGAMPGAWRGAGGAEWEEREGMRDVLGLPSTILR